uniref:H/ACA ribonucleoprotein complex non-core subunit NAF1 n=1 Tax=Albugo laibachii Nc14 TaxID=890382 RepID=F0WTA2_9STRA|nr:H/ACA ribonucleoprotein complex noncore subunit NAF1 putative [Albugo laibachii Nc14]|eukprot:CCA24591.1 H/ACA ribonucleoprotein complex noncore subunit NAF1 putative [Albugo laibachii Nc14]
MADTAEAVFSLNANSLELASHNQQRNTDFEVHLPSSDSIDDSSQQKVCIDAVNENESSEEGEIEEDESCRPIQNTNVLLIDHTKLSTQERTPFQRQLTDLEIAAQYASVDMEAVSVEFASAAIKAESETSMIDNVPTHNHSMLTKINVENEGFDSDTTLSDDNEEDDDKCVLAATIEAKMKREEDTPALPPRTVNEIDPVPVQAPSIELKPACPIATCGTILNICKDALSITIQGMAQSQPLNEGSVVCLQDRTILGCIDEIFGPVIRPMYLVRFASLDQIPEHVAVGMPVSYSTDQAEFIKPSTLHVKGSDASNRYDEEVEQQEFSDDEEEAATKKANRKRNRGLDNAENGTNHNNTNSRYHNPTLRHSTRQAPKSHGRDRRHDLDQRMYPNQNLHQTYAPQYFPHHHPYAPHSHPAHPYGHPSQVQGPSPSYPPHPLYSNESSQQWYGGPPQYPYPMHPEHMYHPSQAHPNSYTNTYPYPPQQNSHPSRYRGRQE